MKNICLIITILLSLLPASAQQKICSQEVMDLNKRAVKLHIRNLSNKDSIAKALNLLDQAIALDYTYLTTYENKMNILFLEKRYNEALKTIDIGIKYNPKEHGFYLLKAKVLEEQGCTDLALSFYKKALDICDADMNNKSNVASFIDSFFLKYCVYGIDTPANEVIAAIPLSFTKEQRNVVVGFFDMFGSFKKFKDGFVKNNSLPLNHKRSAMPKKREDGVYYVVDELAEYPGGHDAMLAFISENFKKPSSINKSGTILVNFVVEADGTLTNIVVKHGLCEGLDKEALRVVGIMPKWKPAKVDGKAVAMVFNIPFTIK